MNWMVAAKLREVVEGILSAVDALQEAQKAEAEGTITAISYAYVEVVVDALARALIVKTGNRAFHGDRNEIRRGRVGGWALVWERFDIGVISGEDFMPEELREWLLEHTEAEERDW